MTKDIFNKNIELVKYGDGTTIEVYQQLHADYNNPSC